MQIIVQMDDSDYSGIAEIALPVIIEALADKPDAAIWLKLLSKFKGPAAKIAAIAFMTLPRKTKNKIIANVINKYIAETLARKGIPVIISDVTATQSGIELTGSIKNS